MINEGNPEGMELAEVLQFGNPWHGLVTNGLLDAGNGTSKTWPQPVGGKTILVRVPAAPGPVMSQAELDAEALLGRTWLDYAILAGDNAQLYGVNTGMDWLYIDGAGTRWAITVAPEITTLQASVTFVFSFTRFGEIGGVPETFTRQVIVADIGQSTPVFTPTDITTGVITVLDARETGDRAVAMIHAPGTDYEINRDLFGEIQAGEAAGRIIRPLGFLEYRISGDGQAGIAVTVEVMATRDTTLGVASSTAIGGTNQVAHCWEYPTGAWHAVHANDQEFTLITALDDRLVGYYYDDQGTATPVKWSWAWTRTVTSDVSLGDWSRYTDTVQTTSLSATLEMGAAGTTTSWTQIKRDVVADDYYAQTHSWSHNEDATFSDLEPFSYTSSGSGTPQGGYLFPVDDGYCDAYPNYIPVTAADFSDLSRYNGIEAGLIFQDAAQYRIYADRHTPTCYSPYIPKTAGRQKAFARTIHRGGVETTVVRDSGNMIGLASDHPVTGQCAPPLGQLVCFI